MDLTIDLEVFQGPFDLLLHLIKTMEIDINDIPIAEITQQYMKVIDSMKELQLDMVGDYLVMAATLIEIKSRMLLPIEPLDDLDSDYNDSDPRQALVQQLLIYQQFQSVSDQLQILEDQRSQVFTRPIQDLTDFQEIVPLEPNEISLDDLSQAMISCLKAALDRQPQTREVRQDLVSVDEMMESLLTSLDRAPSQVGLNFNDFIQDLSRPIVITSFIAMLELVRKQVVNLYQEGLFQPIYMRTKEEKSDDD